METKKPDAGQVRDDQGRTIPQRIRDLREERGQPAYSLAKRVGISASYMSLIENGEKIPSESVALQLARELGDDPELYLAWVHGARLSHPERTLRGLRRYSPGRRPRHLRDEVASSMREELDQLPADVAESRLPRASRRLARFLDGEPDPDFSIDLVQELGSFIPNIFEVPVLGPDDPPEGAVVETYWLDPRLLPDEVNREGVYAYRVTEPIARRVSDRLEIGDLVVLSPSVDRKPSPDRIHAVKIKSDGVILSRIQRMGTRLILLPGPRATDVEIIDLGPKKRMEGVVVGTVVAIVRTT